MSMIIDGTSGVTFPNSTVQASAGSVIQVVQGTYSTTTSTAAAAFSDTGLSASITPKFSTSKILVLVSLPIFMSRAGNDVGARLQVVRGSTVIYTDAGETSNYSLVSNGTAVQFGYKWNTCYLDSPATTGSTTYKIQQYAYNGCTVYAQPTSTTSLITLIEVAA